MLGSRFGHDVSHRAVCLGISYWCHRMHHRAVHMFRQPFTSAQDALEWVAALHLFHRYMPLRHSACAVGCSHSLGARMVETTGRLRKHNTSRMYPYSCLTQTISRSRGAGSTFHEVMNRTTGPFVCDDWYCGLTARHPLFSEKQSGVQQH